MPTLGCGRGPWGLPLVPRPLFHASSVLYIKTAHPPGGTQPDVNRGVPPGRMGSVGVGLALGGICHVGEAEADTNALAIPLYSIVLEQ